MSDYKNQETASWDAGRVRDGGSRSSGSGGTGHPRKHRRPKRMGGIQYALLIVVISMILAGAGWLLINDFCSFNKPEVTTTVEITADDNIGSVATKLKNAGLIEYKWFFDLFATMAHAKSTIGIGTYTLNSDMDYMALITAMHNSSGSMNTDTVRVTIPEGYTVRQIITLLASKGVNTEDALTEAAQSATFDYDFIDNHSEDISRLEGYLFPDTYDFYLNEKPASALRRLLSNFASKMDDDVMAQVDQSGYSLKQIITVASLIEKETAGKDQADIASVIYNRLKGTGSAEGTYGKLQIDASLLYALPDHTGEITSADMKTDSPYNLYQNAGLPPTPIANPGMTSIEAALKPNSTDYYYYALGKDGVHHFFKTYAEHQKFVNSDEYAGN